MAVYLHLREYTRRQFRKQRVFRDRTHPLDAYDDDDIRRRYRLSREMILELYNMFGNDLEPVTNRNHAFPGMLQIFCALRYYDCGSFQTVVGDGLGVHRSTVSKIVTRVTMSLCRLKTDTSNYPDCKITCKQPKRNSTQ